MKAGIRRTCVDAIPRKGFFSLAGIADRTGLKQERAYKELQWFVREGYLDRHRIIKKRCSPVNGNAGIKNIVYSVTALFKDLLRARDNPRYHKNTAWDRLWKAIRVLKRFQRQDLVVTAGVRKENAKFFLFHLKRAGYVGLGAKDEWFLCKDPGPERPSWAEIKRRAGGHPSKKDGSALFIPV